MDPVQLLDDDGVDRLADVPVESVRVYLGPERVLGVELRILDVNCDVEIDPAALVISRPTRSADDKAARFREAHGCGHSCDLRDEQDTAGIGPCKGIVRAIAETGDGGWIHACEQHAGNLE